MTVLDCCCNFGLGQLEGYLRHFSLSVRPFYRVLPLAEVKQVKGRHDPYEGEAMRQQRKNNVLISVSAHGRDGGNISQFLYRRSRPRLYYVLLCLHHFGIRRETFVGGFPSPARTGALLICGDKDRCYRSFRWI